MSANNGSARRTAIVVGGSLGGLFAANLLQRRGWSVTVFERVQDALAGRGAGIVTHPELFHALTEAGCPVDETIGVAVQKRVTLNRDGSIAGSLPLAQILTAWSKLYHLLRSAFPDARYVHGVSVVDVASDQDGAVATLSDGSQYRADLLIAADGLRSLIRQKVLPDVELEYAGYVAWRGLVEEHELSPETRQAIFEKFGFCIPPGEQMLGYPVAGLNNSIRTGERRYNFVWYRPTAGQQGLDNLLTDEKGTTHPFGIAPHLIRPEVLKAMRAAAQAVLAPQFCEVIEKVRQPMFQPIYDLEVPRLAFDRIALLGDAAFVGRPHCGMGVTKAAGDAMQLAQSLSSHVDIGKALMEYDSHRVKFGAAVVTHARHLGAYMQSQTKSETEKLMAEKYRTPEAVMRETAVPLV
ncbi:MAG: FAD binding domain-containing protein [Steroidobacteraceae bacterium]